MKVRGLGHPRRLSEAATAALQSGDVDALLAINRAEFGGFVMMADPDDDDDDDDDNDDDNNDDDDNPSGDDDDDDDAGKKKKDEDDDDDDSDARLKKMRRRMIEADKRRDAAEKELNRLKDKDKPDLERAQNEVKELGKQVETLTSTVSSLRLQNAFLTANKHEWHDAETALALAQSKGYLEDVADEDGEVDKKELGKALDRLAKEHAYLTVTKKKSSDDDDQPPGPSGLPGGKRSDNSKDGKRRKKDLQNRFPVLR